MILGAVLGDEPDDRPRVLDVAIAASHHYFQHINGWRGVLSAIFAVFLWPLILLGIDLHIKK